MHIKGENDETALMSAATWKGDGESMSLLLQAEAKVNQHNKQDSTVLILAVCTGRHKYIEMLLKAGAHVNVQDTYGTTALINAAHGDSGIGSNNEVVNIDDTSFEL